MESNALTHHGILGMRWGVRRTKAQLERARGKTKSEQEEETVEEKRARLLKSTNAKELFENKDILSTAELNERLSRIDAERRLGEIAAKTKKDGYDYVNSALKFGRKVNEVYEFTNTPVAKALKKQILGEQPKKAMSLKDAYDKRDKLTTAQLQDAFKRASTEKAMKGLLDELDKKKE